MLEATIEAARPTTAKRVKRIEEELGVEFPAAYRAFLLAFNGGRPVPAHFVYIRDGVAQWAKIHFFFGIDDDTQSCDLLWIYKTLVGRLPPSVIPVASDEFGNMFCLDLRASSNGPVVFWDHELEGRGHEHALRAQVAQTFADWLNQLTVRA